MNAAFYTLGCKVNQYESQAMVEALRNSGFEIVSSDSEADVYIVNSCTVTSESDRKTKQAVRHFKRLHPDSVVVLTGCMPQSYPQIASELNEADIVLGNASNDRLVESILEFLSTRNRVLSMCSHFTGEKFQEMGISGFSDRTRAFVKIQDGCNRFCSYCIIPAARGRVRSRSTAGLKAELERLAASGYVEAVLVGINLSAYGQDNGLTICDAVHTACSVDGILRVRLGSLEPDHITDEVISRLAQEPKLCPQFHISLQSGCDETLKRMNRHYTSSEYSELCGKLREHFRNCSITTDIMVGFPGETEDEFDRSLRFVEKTGFARAHIFPYSIRSGTKAAIMPDQISNSVKSQRVKLMSEVTSRTRTDFLKSQIGGTYEVLFETETPQSEYVGYTANYTHVRVSSPIDITRKLCRVKITGVDNDFCRGVIIE